MFCVKDEERRQKAKELLRKHKIDPASANFSSSTGKKKVCIQLSIVHTQMEHVCIFSYSSCVSACVKTVYIKVFSASSLLLYGHFAILAVDLHC